MVHGLSTSMAWLLLLVAQNTSKTLLLRWAVGTGKPHFLYSAAVLATEGLKASLSIAWVLRAGGSPSSIVRFLRTEWRIFLRVMVPAGIYNAQQMLEFVALSRLEAPVSAHLTCAQGWRSLLTNPQHAEDCSASQH